MAINLNDNIKVLAGKPTDARYLNNLAPYASELEVNTLIDSVERYTGLTVNINGVEYWYKEGIDDINLVIKTAGAGTGTLTGATNGLSLIDSGTTVILGGNLTTGTTFNGLGTYPVTFQNISDFQVIPSGSTSVLGIDTQGIFLEFSGTSVQLCGNAGLTYDSDYSANYVNRSLVDKGYVDLAISAATSGITGTLTGATNGVCVDGANVKLGGALSETTTICGDNHILCLGTISSCLNLFDVEAVQSQIQSDCIYVNGTTCTQINGGAINVCLTSTCGLITDNRAGGLKYGLEYAADYSADFQANSLITKFYADSIASGLDPKLAACVATIGNITLSGTPTIDGITVVDGWRILVKNQISGDTNGIYVVNSGGTWSRSIDFDFNPPTGEVVQGALVPVITGNTQRNTIWVLTTPDPIVTGDTLTFGLFSGPIVTAGHGIVLSGMTISVDGDALDGNSILWSGGTFNVDINSGTLQTALASKLSIVTFTGYSATTKIDIDSKLPIATFSGYTGTTLNLINSKLDEAIFTGYTASTQPIIDNAITGVTIVGSGESIVSGITEHDIYIKSIIGSGATVVTNSGNTVVIYSSGGTGVEKFTDDIIVSIAAGKTFGKYENGDTIPASGKTPAEVIMMALIEALEPTLSLSSSAQNLAFGLSAKTVNLTFSYTINTLGASVDTVLLEWRRGNTGSWSALTTNTGATTYNHIVYEVNRFNTAVINYRYTVVDTAGATGVTTYDITPTAYVAPTFSPTYTNTGLQSYETNAIREKGNVSSTIAGTIDSNNAYVNITGYTVYRCVDGGAYAQLYSCAGLSSTAPISIASCLDSGAAGAATTVGYCIRIGDEYSSAQNGGTCTITFRYASYYGYCVNTSISGLEIVALGNGALCTTRARTMTLTATGGNYTYVAYPESYGYLTSAIMDGAAPVLGAFSCSCDNSVTNIYGQAVDYNLYKSNAPNAFTANSVAFS